MATTPENWPRRAPHVRHCPHRVKATLVGKINLQLLHKEKVIIDLDLVYMAVMRAKIFATQERAP
jgi:hypothetical protein